MDVNCVMAGFIVYQDFVQMSIPCEFESMSSNRCVNQNVVTMRSPPHLQPLASGSPPHLPTLNLTLMVSTTLATFTDSPQSACRARTTLALPLPSHYPRTTFALASHYH